MPKRKGLTVAEADAVRWHIDRYIVGHVKALVKLKQMNEIEPCEAFAKQIQYEQWSIAALQDCYDGAKPVKERRHGSADHSRPDSRSAKQRRAKPGGANPAT